MSVEDGRVVSNFIVQALTSNPITIYGNGLQTRSFCFVDDMVMGLIALMESNAICTGPINLGNPSEFTIKQLAEMILLLTKSSSLIVHRDLPTDDPRIRKPDISIAKNTLNWSPTVELSQGLELTIRYFQSIL
jgi:UDP-glucuronate decarboxylase